MSSAEDFFGGGPKNPPALRFYPGPHQPYRSPDIGYHAGGQILQITVRQQRDYETSALKTYEDGNPMRQAETILQTNLRGEPYDPEGTPDDGRRTLYVSGQMTQAIANAVRKSGDKTGIPKPGGFVEVWCLSIYDEVKKKKKNTWDAIYTPGQLPQQASEFFGGQQQQQQQQYAPQPQQYQQPQYQPQYQQPQQPQQYQQPQYPPQQQHAPQPTVAQQEFASTVAKPLSMLEQIKQSGLSGPNPANQNEEPPF